MKTEWRRFAPLGLYLALVAAIVSFGLFIVQRSFNLPLQISLGFLVVGLAIFAILDPDRVRQAVTGRQARYGSNALVMVLAFLGIIVVINYLVNKYPTRWDLTQDKTHTLAPETIKLVQSLPQPVSAVGFFTTRTSNTTAKNLLDDYKRNSNGKFDYKFINPDQDPVAAQNAKITQDGTIVLTMGTRQEQTTSTVEQDLDTSLIKLTNPGPRNIYFLVGHGEHDTGGSGQTAYSLLKTALEGKSYTVKTLNLLSTAQVPTDAMAVIIAGPQKPLTANEIKALQSYQDKGGSLIVELEPTVTDSGDVQDPILSYLGQTWNISVGNDVVIDPTINPPTFTAALNFASHPITDQMNKNLGIIFPTARSVQYKGASADTVELIKTSDQAWGETNFTDLQNSKANFDKGQDTPGPVPVAVAAQDTTKKSKVVVVGDSDFVTDAFINQVGNEDFFINTIDWATGQSNLISLTPKQTTSRIILPPQSYVVNLIFLASIFVLPGLVLFSGIMTWVQRRRRG